MMKQVKFRMPRRMLTLTGGLLLAASSWAQSGAIKGQVKDATGEPIMGATITANGKAVGITDMDGNYSINVAPGTKLTITYLGMTPQTVTAGDNMVVTLKDDEKTLNDVVVIGYGAVKKSDLTGSVMSVEADQLNKGLATSPADLLQGKTPGVVITNAGGRPGAGSTIRVRGGSSLSASNDPLIVIDGLPISSTGISGGDVLSTINPNDIESFSILKDASATAIYGSRASNGVILITTKKGKSGKVKVNVDLTGSWQTLTKYVDNMNASEFTDFFKQNYGSNADAMAALGNADTDWQKKIYRDAFAQEVNASITGGVAAKDQHVFNMPYRISAGALNDDGVLRTTGMKRGSASVNLSPSLLDNRLKINLNMKGVYTHNEFADEGAIAGAVLYDPCKPVYDANGIHGYTAWMGNGIANTMSQLNPVAQLEEQDKTSNIRRFIGNSQFDYSFKYVPGLRANLNLGLDISTTTGWNILNAGSEASLHDKVQNGAGMYEKYGQLRRDQTLEFYLDYARDLKSIYSHFDILAGYSWQHFYNSTTDVQLPLDQNLVKSYTYTPRTATESYLISFYGRLNWTLQDKYMFTFTLRDDGTSRFKNNKWGLFPSAAFAWRVSDEPVFKNMKYLSNLKLRLGWGITGQQNINQGDYPSIGTYTTNTYKGAYQFGDRVILPYTLNPYATDIKWESTWTYNVGLDYGWFNNRINGSVDFYVRKTKDLLNDITIPSLTNVSNHALMNIGNMKNVGVEFAINFVPVETADWHWDLGFNLAWNKNKITKLTASDDPTYVGVETGGITGGTGNNIQLHRVGYPMSSFWVYQQVYDKDGHPLEGVYVDRNGDGKIDNDDRYLYKKPDADVTMGLNTSLSWKRWTLSASARASLGNYVYNNVASNTEMKADMWTNSFIANRLKSAAFSNFSQAQYLSDYYVQNASFLKLDKVTLAYQATKWLRLNVTAQNVFTITNYDGLDPEVAGGIDYSLYPRPLTILVGANLNF